MPRQSPPETTPAPDVLARVGLTSMPAEVVSLSVDRVLFVTSWPCAPGRTTVLELATADRGFRRLLPLRVTWSGPRDAGLHGVAGQFRTPLTRDEIRLLSVPACLAGGVSQG